MARMSFIDRLKNLTLFQAKKYDLVIIGGGITGAGVARDAASRGMSVALIEKDDFASGTSSRSSKLIHGGIRYLENLEFKLVFEALNERTKLFEMCPHLVHHLRFMLPLYRDSRVGMFKMGMGMWLYDALALFQAPELHESLSSTETIDRMPMLRGHNLRGSYVYSDGYMDDDRLVLETLRSAASMGAVCANFVRADKAIWTEGKVTGVEAVDSLTGRRVQIRGRHVISTVGPWTDELGSSLFTDWKKILRPTKGIHFTLPRERLQLPCAVVMAAEKEDRIVFGIPRKEMIVIGTTDTDYPGLPDGIVADKADVDYLLGFTDQYFPGAKIKKEDILATYAGVRPLVRDDAGTAGKTSREHTILPDPRGVTFVAGGKYTTYRRMAEQIVTTVLKNFPVEDRVKFRLSDTAKPLNEWTSPEAYRQAFHESDELVHLTGRSRGEILHLCERYGREVHGILSRYNSEWTLWQLEAAHAIDTTMCLNLVDFYARRVPLYLADPAHGMTVLDSVAAVFQQQLRWSPEQTDAQKQKLREFLERELRWKTSS